MEWTRIEEDPEAESIWVEVVPRANMSLGCAEDDFLATNAIYGSSITRTMINGVSGEVLLRLASVNVPFIMNMSTEHIP